MHADALKPSGLHHSDFDASACINGGFIIALLIKFDTVASCPINVDNKAYVLPNLTCYTVLMTAVKSSMSNEINQESTTTPTPNIALVRICSQEERLQILDQYCASHPELEQFHQHSDSPLPSYIHQLVDEKHQVVFTLVPKVASSLWSQLFVIAANGGERPDMLYYSHVPNYLRRFGLRLLSNYSDRQRNNIIRKYYKVLLVRHPVDRLLSGYVNKFLKGPMEHETARSVKYMNQHYKLPTEWVYPDSKKNPIQLNFTFHEFVRLVTDPDAPHNQHWDSYTNIANPCLIKYDYIMKTETMSRDAEPILSKLTDGNPELLLKHVKRVHGTRDAQDAQDDTTYKADELASRGKPLEQEILDLTNKEMEVLQRTVRADMEMFGYGLEENVDNTIATCIYPDHQCC